MATKSTTTKRATSTQFDTALMEQIAHARNMNIPANALSSAASFVLMVRKRLYGDQKLLAAANEAVSRLIQDAQAERAQYEIEEKERQRRAQQRIVIPGDTGFRN